MLEVTSIRNLKPREGKDSLHLVFSPALFPPPKSNPREGAFPASALLGDTGRDREFVTKEARAFLLIFIIFQIPAFNFFLFVFYMLLEI